VPIAEGEISWNGFLKEVGFGGTQVYEVSGESVIQIGFIEGDVIQLRCLEGDTFYDGVRNVRMSTSVDVSPRALLLIGYENVFNTNDPLNIRIQSTGVIGANVTPRMDGGSLTFDVPVTATGLCFSPSSLMTIGGEWQATDTTALIIGYSVLNAYWIAPIGIGIGVGIYLVKRRF